MAKTLYAQVFDDLERKLGSQYHEIIDMEKRTQKTEDGEVKEYLRYTLEIRRNVGLGGLARCRFSVKVPFTDNQKVSVSSEELAAGGEYLAKPIGLKVSFVDQQKTIYFKCDAMDVITLGDEIVEL